MSSFGKDIIMVGYAGLNGSAKLASSYNKDRLPKTIITRLQELSAWEEKFLEDDQLLILINNIASEESDIVYPASKGGVFRGLWNMAEELKTGLTVYLENISIKQETIEICEEYDVNPYMLYSPGVVLVVSDKGNGLVREFNRAGLHSNVIGFTTNTKDRIVVSGDEKRYIESRIQEELERIGMSERSVD